jgi:hypothetical protein
VEFGVCQKESLGDPRNQCDRALSDVPHFRKGGRYRALNTVDGRRARVRISELVLGNVFVWMAMLLAQMFSATILF